MNIKLCITTVSIVVTTTTVSYATEASYACDGGTELTAIFSPVGATPGQVELLIGGGDGDIVLPQAQAADGGRYAEGDTEFRIKGDSATFTQAGRTQTCTVKPAKAG